MTVCDGDVVWDIVMDKVDDPVVDRDTPSISITLIRLLFILACEEIRGTRRTEHKR